MKKNKSNLGVILLVLLLVVIIAVVLTPTGNGDAMKYSEMVSLFKEQKVSQFTLDLGTGEMQLTLNGSDKTVKYKLANLSLFVNDVNEYIKAYDKAHPTSPMVYDYVPAEETPWWLSMLPSFLLLIGMGVFWFIMMNQAGGGGKIMNVGKARVKDQSDEKDKKTFADVAGADEEKAELQEIVDFLKDPKKYSVMGAKIPHGVLLQGPPGTGKTLLAKACAGEANVPFFAISGSDFVEMYVGVGASRVRDLFDKAKKAAPAVIFIDEIDAVGRQRGTGLGGGHDEREQTLNQLLVEMDGFGATEGVIVMAATNRSDVLDKALLRPGRFDRQIYVGTPDVVGREAILKVHARNKPLAPDVNLAEVARYTTGFTGADLANLLNEAALLAVKKNRKAIVAQDILDSVTKVIMGVEKKSHRITDKDKQLTAYHEAGHAIIGYLAQPEEPVHEVSIIPRGMGAGGYTLYLPNEDISYNTKKQMVNEILSLLGGRVAEKLVLDDISTGASNDLERATAIARAMVTRFGFSDKLGPVVYGTDPSETFLGRDFSQGRGYSEEIAGQIDTEIRDMLDAAFEKDVEILSAHMGKLHALAQVLLDREKITGEEFIRVMQGDELPPPQTPVVENPAPESPVSEASAPAERPKRRSKSAAKSAENPAQQLSFDGMEQPQPDETPSENSDQQ